MRGRSALLLVGAAALLALWRRLAARERVEIYYDDGSFVRLVRGVEAADLLRDAREIVAAVAP